jgi:hypothetical protein
MGKFFNDMPGSLRGKGQWSEIFFNVFRRILFRRSLTGFSPHATIPFPIRVLQRDFYQLFPEKQFLKQILK